MNRRQFLASAGAAGAALSIPQLAAASVQPLAAGSGPNAIWVDSLGALDGFGRRAGGKMEPTPELVQAIRQGWINVISQTLGEVGNGPERFRLAVESVAGANRHIANNPTLLMKIDSVADIREAKRSGRLGIIYNFQDTAPLEADASRVAVFKGLGLRIQQLTYNKRNLAGDGCLEPANGGISDFGWEVIAAVNQNRLLLDLSHSGQRTIAEGIAAAKAPPAITHTGCRDLVDLPRNTFDRELRALADKGGVVGIYLMPFLRTQGQPGTEDLIRHLEHAVKVAGEDHVGIGTDNPLMGYIVDDNARKQQREFFEDRKRRGIAAPGEAADVLNLVEGYNDARRYVNLARDLKAKGWKSARIDKVLGGNFVRLFGEVWGA